MTDHVGNAPQALRPRVRAAVCNLRRAGLAEAMLVIRRLDDGRRSYTALFLPGEPARIFPTSNYEHARLLQIYKQDRPYRDVWNDFTEYRIEPFGSALSAPPPPASDRGAIPPA